MEDVRDWVASIRKIDRNDQRMERPMTLRKMLLAAGLKQPRPLSGKKQERFQIDPTRGKSHVVANFDIEAGQGWPALKPFYMKPEEVLGM